MSGKICEQCQRTFHRGKRYPVTFAAIRFCSKSCATRARGGGFEARFWAKVDKRGPDECWPWLASTTPFGYGQIRRGNRMPHAHRVAYALTFGPILGGLHVCHRCDNPPCVNPAHLFLGTNRDNSMDRHNKGRTASGEKSGHARLKADDVLAIRASTESAAVLASRYGVNAMHISGIRRGKCWRTV